MPVRKAKVIGRPKPGTWTAPTEKYSEPIMIIGEGDLSVICGNCDMVLVKNIIPGQLGQVTVGCPRCGCINDVSEACI